MNFYQEDILLEFHDMPICEIIISFTENQVILKSEEYMEYTKDYEVVTTRFKGVQKVAFSDPLGEVNDRYYEITNLNIVRTEEGINVKIIIINGDSFTLEIQCKEITVERKLIYGLKV